MLIYTKVLGACLAQRKARSVRVAIFLVVLGEPGGIQCDQMGDTRSRAGRGVGVEGEAGEGTMDRCRPWVFWTLR